MSLKTARLPVAATVTAIATDNYRTKTFTLDVSLAAHPGQFVMLWLPGFDEKPFSLVSADPVRLMITDVGPFTSLIHETQPGDPLWLRGPFGHGFVPPEDERRVLLVGGGYGVAPLLWLAQQMAGRVPHVASVIGARNVDELLYENRFTALAKAETGTKYDLYITTDDGTRGQRGLVIDVVRALLDEPGADCIYACGPHPMLAALRELAHRHQVACQLSWEEYMRCGMGLCGSCELDGALLCMDGPVIHYAP